MSHCISTQQLREFKDRNGTPYNLENFTTDELQGAIDESEAIIEKVCGTKFYTLREVWLLDGSGSDILRFPPAIPYPLLSIESVEEVNEVGEVEDTFIENDDFVSCRHYLRTGPTGSSIRLRRIASTQGVWPTGIRNIKVTGLWGWATCPPVIKKAVKLLALESISQGITGFQSSDVVQQSWPDYTVTFRSNASGSGGLSASPTGVPYIDRILANYINWSTLFMRGNQYAYLVSSEAEPEELAGEGIRVLEQDMYPPEEGKFWYNSTERVFKGFNGTDVFVVGTPNPATLPLPTEDADRPIAVYPSDPVAPVEGDFWFNTAEGVFKGFNGVNTLVVGNADAGLSETGSRYVGSFFGDPVSPETGSIWFNITDKVWKLFNGTSTTVIGS